MRVVLQRVTQASVEVDGQCVSSIGKTGRLRLFWKIEGIMTELIEKKSRFIAYSFNISDEAEVKSIVERLRTEHKRSRHVVYAYVVAGKEKFNDDGEPNGTAGLPVLNAIKRRNLENIIVVVVRYFGGILLGKGGLMRAYGKAAGQELEKRDV
jgi:thymidylate synthase